MLSTPLPSQLDSPNAQMEQMANSLRETPPRRIRFDTTVIFLDSAKNGELETVTSTQPADIEIATATGMTAVCLAANYGHLEVLEYLIGEGGDVNASCEDGCTPLHLAILEEHVEIITCLLKHGADITATNIDDESALDWAADSEPIRLCELPNHAAAALWVLVTWQCAPSLLCGSSSKLTNGCCACTCISFPLCSARVQVAGHPTVAITFEQWECNVIPLPFLIKPVQVRCTS